jgi:hypothetical protein
LQLKENHDKSDGYDQQASGDSSAVARLLRANFSLERSLWVRELSDESA